MENYNIPVKDDSGIRFERDGNNVKIILRLFGFDNLLNTLGENERKQLIELLK